MLPGSSGREGLALGAGKLVRDLVEPRVEQVAENSERELGLRFGSGGCQHGEATLPSGLDRGAPDRCLADSRLAFEQQDPRAGVVGIEEGLDSCALPVPADQLGHAGSMRRLLAFD